ncbi:MAG: hypothetical protein WC890_05410 [Candidatus Margulisiibacteriota bacterium]
MFKNLGDLAYKRVGWEILGFYLAYLGLIILLAILIGAIGGSMGVIDAGGGIQLGTIVAVISCLVLSFLLIQKKNALGNFPYILLAILSGILAVIGGGLLGLIPIAYLSSR